MIKLQTNIEGKRAYFGVIKNIFQSHGCSFCSNFDYHQGKFDALLWREGGESIYLRMPIYVVNGELDYSNALIEFGTPFVIKHVVNIGLDYDENSLLTATTGLNQFQDPLDTDGYIRDKSRWAKAGEETVNMIMNSINGVLVS
ncbi:YugN family protein [Schinkia azotoformans]|uniref:YugN family protein n=1 Tax=Schinkia azotoformans TaxID=1454 RepID=UPI002DB6DEF0|nr:YugN family protein [Schinkia azotoformans]MEC1722056.1 YugN family protein [Schinkia azotoformans]MED4415239.1 YugN family protein [Schinkia azotoformans]